MTFCEYVSKRAKSLMKNNPNDEKLFHSLYAAAISSNIYLMFEKNKTTDDEYQMNKIIEELKNICTTEEVSKLNVYLVNLEIEYNYTLEEYIISRCNGLIKKETNNKGIEKLQKQAIALKGKTSDSKEFEQLLKKSLQEISSNDEYILFEILIDKMISEHNELGFAQNNNTNGMKK